MSANPNMKTFVLSILNPFIVALRTLYDQHVATMFKTAKKQNDVIAIMQANFASLKEEILVIQAEIIEYRIQMTRFNNIVITQEDAKKLSQRTKELELICGALFDIVYTIKSSGKIPDNIELPDYDYPIIPSESGLTDEELEEEFRKYREIEEGAELTEEQLVDFNGYKNAYLSKYPREEEYPEEIR